MLITGAYTIVAIHRFKWSGTENRHAGASNRRPKIRSGQLKDLGGIYHLVNSTAFFLANPHATHQVRHAFISGLISVNKPVQWNDRFSWIRNLDTIRKQFHHDGCAAFRKLLMDQGIRHQFTNRYVRHKLHLSSKRIFNDLVLGKLGHDKFDQPLKSDGIALGSRLVNPRLQLRCAGIHDYAGRLSCNFQRKLPESPRQQ